MGKTSKKLKALQKKQGEAAEAAMQGIPQSMVFRRGKVGPYVSDLVSDMRRVMLPYTAKSLKESKKNNLKDFSSVAAPLGVTHFMIFSQTVTGTNLRLTRLPHGPTFTFRLSNYSNIKDIVHMQKTPHSPGTEYQNPPLVVLNNFSAAALAQAEELAKQEDAEERTAFEAARAANPTSTLNPPSVEILKLTSTMWQNAFPPIDVANLQVKNCRRVVILQYEPRTCQVLFRHYLITAAPVGINKAIKKLIKNKVPDLSKLDDISEYIKSEHMAQLSDSEAEDAPDARITLPQSFVGRGNRSNSKSAIRLKEIGPRFTMQLLKVEEEMDGGKVMYHYRRSLTEKEALELAHKSKLKRDEKARRRAEQERNVERKNKRKRGEDEENDDDDQAEALETDPSIMVNAPHDEYSDEEDEDGDANMGTKSTKKKKSSGNSDADDDAEWYRKEVGEEPQEGLFDRSSESKSDRSFPLKAERRAEEIARKREASESKARKGLSKGNGNSDADDDEEDEKNGMQPQKKKQRMGGSHKKFGVSAEKQSGGGQGGHNVRHSDFKAAEAKLAKKESAKGKPATAPKKKGGKQ